MWISILDKIENIFFFQMDQESEHPQYILDLVGDILAVLFWGALGFFGSCVTYRKFRSPTISHNFIKLICNGSMVDLCQLDKVNENGYTSAHPVQKHETGEPQKT